METTAQDTAVSGTVISPQEIVDRALGLLRSVAPREVTATFTDRGHLPSTLIYTGHTDLGRMPTAELGPFQVSGWEAKIKGHIRALGEPFYSGALDNAVTFGYAGEVSLSHMRGYWLQVTMRVMPLYSSAVRGWLSAHQQSAEHGYTTVHQLK